MVADCIRKVYSFENIYNECALGVSLPTKKHVASSNQSSTDFRCAYCTSALLQSVKKNILLSCDAVILSFGGSQQKLHGLVSGSRCTTNSTFLISGVWAADLGSRNGGVSPVEILHNPLCHRVFWIGGCYNPSRLMEIYTSFCHGKHRLRISNGLIPRLICAVDIR